MKEYEFVLPGWDEDLLHALRRWGVEVDREEERELIALLPGLAARWCDRPLEAWRRLTAPGVRAGLFDAEQIRAVLAEPAAAYEALERDGAAGMFRDYLAEAYGVPPEPADSPGGTARRLVQNLVLAEAATAAGAGDFPYPEKLPESEPRERCLGFLRRWLEARSQAGAAGMWLREEGSELRVGPWAASLERVPDLQASLEVERTLVERIVAGLRARGSTEERGALLAELPSVFRRHAGHFWALEGEVREWEALALAGGVAAAAREALAELPALAAAPDLARANTDRWWRVDQAYRRYRADFDGHEGLEEVAATVRWLHRRYLEETNKRFSEALAGSPGLADMGGQTGIELAAARSPLPSITPLGMAWLLPVDALTVSVQEGTWCLRAPGAGDSAPDLATREGRERLLSSLYPGCAFLDLAGLLDLPARKIPQASWLFVFSTTLDQAGHGGVLDLTPGASEEYVERCARAVRKLGAVGVEEVHVATDHGFFLLDQVAEHDLIPVAERGLEYRSHRAVVGREISGPGLLTFPLAGSDLVVGVPRATGILQARGPYQFFHGGASLQEVVVPHLRVTLPRRVARLDVRLRAPDRITNAVFDVEIEAVPPRGQISFGTVPARYPEVRVRLLEGGRASRDSVAAATGPDHYVSETRLTHSVRLRIADTARYRYGDPVRIVVRDADAPDTELARADSVLNVEPGF